MANQNELDIENSKAIQALADSQADIISSVQAENTRATEAEQRIADSVDGKVDKVEGKGLSTNDYTDDAAAEVAKIPGIEQTIQSGVVKSVNGIAPSTQSGDVEIDTVPFAENLTTPADMATESSFTFRTSAGDASILTGDAELQRIIGHAEKVNGTIQIARPTSFISLGLNAFDVNNASMRSGSFAVIRVKGGLDNGYTAYCRNGGTINRVGYAVSASADAANVDWSVGRMTSTDLWHAVGFDEDGYVFVDTASYGDLCVHPAWSGYMDEVYEDYESYTIYPIPDPSGYGLASVAGIADEVNLSDSTYTRRILKEAYSAERVAELEDAGIAYIADSVTILSVDPNPSTVPLSEMVSGYYNANDFGTEEFVGTTVDVTAVICYKPNLRDKLRTDVVMLSEQHLTEHQKRQVRENIGVGQGSVKSVNGELPDESGNVDIIKVPLADNLYSVDNNASSLDFFLSRTSGGTADLSNGDATLLTVVGHANTPEHVLDSVTMTTAFVQSFTATVDATVFATQVTESGQYVFTKTASGWTRGSGDSAVQVPDISVYGITVNGTPIVGDRITVRYTAAESESPARATLTITYATRLTAEINNDLFLANATVQAVEQGVPTVFTFTYDGTNWKKDSDTVTLTDFGITITGSARDRDKVTVNFTREKLGTLVITKPVSFTSIGFNWFDKNTMVDGNIATVPVVPANENGFIVHLTDTSAINSVKFSTEPTGGENAEPLEDVPVFSETELAFKVYEPGYLIIDVTNLSTQKNNLCVHPCWSGEDRWSDSQSGVDGFTNNYAPYTSTTISLPMTGTKDGVQYNLPIGEYGMPSVGTVVDEINLSSLTYTKRIEKVDYSKQAVADLIAAGKVYGTDFTYDATSILKVMSSPEIFILTVDSSYTVNDWGGERFSFSAGGEYPVGMTALYGSNLVDKLRRDVLTLSSSTPLPQAQRNNVLAQLGIEVDNNLTI